MNRFLSALLVVFATWVFIACGEKPAPVPPQEMEVFALEVSDITPTSCHFAVVPADEEQDKILRDFRDRAATEIGLFLPKHETYKFHISLGYRRILPEGEDAKHFETLVAKMDEYIADQPAFETEPPYMAYYSDMYAFSSERLPRRNVYLNEKND